MTTQALTQYSETRRQEIHKTTDTKTQKARRAIKAIVVASRRSDVSVGSDGVGWFQMVRSEIEFRIRRSIPLITLQFRCQIAESDWLVEPDRSDELKKPNKSRKSLKSLMR